MSLILTKRGHTWFLLFFCTALDNLKSNYKVALSRDDAKVIVNTGTFGYHSLPREITQSIMKTFGDGFCVFLTVGVKSRKGASMFWCLGIFIDCIGVRY